MDSINKELKDREYLYKRHRLSHQQIDRLLGESLKKVSMSEKIHQLETIKNFLTLTDTLKKRDISFVPLKGCLLSQRIYGDPTVRISHDIDLLVPIKDLNRTVSLMKEEGFNFTDKTVWPEKKEQQGWLFHILHHIEFYNKEKHLTVEIHWSLTENSFVPIEKGLQLLSENLTEVTFIGRKFKVMNPEFELLFLLMHGSIHGWKRLKWLMDIRDYPVKNIDMEKWTQLIKIFNARRIIGQTSYLLDYYFNAELPLLEKRHVPSYFLKYPLHCIGKEIDTIIPTKELTKELYYFLFLFPSVSYKIRVMYNRLFNPNDLKHIDTSCKLVYYFYRPYSFIKRRILNA